MGQSSLRSAMAPLIPLTSVTGEGRFCALSNRDKPLEHGYLFSDQFGFSERRRRAFRYCTVSELEILSTIFILAYTKCRCRDTERQCQRSCILESCISERLTKYRLPLRVCSSVLLKQIIPSLYPSHISSSSSIRRVIINASPLHFSPAVDGILRRTEDR
jgi:hypothetical protein